MLYSSNPRRVGIYRIYTWSSRWELPEQEAAPVSTPNDAGTPAPAEHTAQVQGRALGPRVAQRETPDPRAARLEVRGPRVARPRAPWPRLAQQGSPEAVPVCRENLQEKDRQVTVAEPLGQSETKTPARGQEKVWRRWSRGNPTRQKRRVGRSECGER